MRVDVPNIVHAYQTAERIREVHPDKDWFHLTGLIHDLGKIMSMYGEHQWATTGDTYPVGCDPAASIVYRDTSFDKNPDINDPRYSSKLGIYEEGCGLDKLMMTWGHDEYMYQVLKNHPTCTLPEEGLYAIRFHSFYPWHTGRDYTFFENETDKKMYPWLMEMNKFDLYSKSDDLPDIEKLEGYYQGLIDKYMPGLIKW
uniref:Inositol oxygenase n=1 Tax=Plectus sambesii TaxID=2011161 RepID=A0A914VXD0_9BILA